MLATARLPSRLAPVGAATRPARSRQRGARAARRGASAAAAPPQPRAAPAPRGAATSWDANLASTFDWRRQWYPVAGPHERERILLYSRSKPCAWGVAAFSLLNPSEEHSSERPFQDGGWRPFTPNPTIPSLCGLQPEPLGVSSASLASCSHLRHAVVALHPQVDWLTNHSGGAHVPSQTPAWCDGWVKHLDGCDKLDASKYRFVQISLLNASTRAS